jgi:hypothetical protein
MEKTLYFSSNRRESKGGYDLFKSIKGPDGEWGKPENLGKNVNTKTDEISVSISPNEKPYTSAPKAITTWEGSTFSSANWERTGNGEFR